MRTLYLAASLVLAAIASAVDAAEVVSSTRVGAFDYQCQNADGTKISDHARPDIAALACATLSLADGKVRYVQGGRWRISVSGTTPPPAPPPTTGTVNLSWTAPTLNTDGSVLTDLAGYRLYHGLSATALTDMVQLPGSSTTSYAYTQLATGAHYFAVTAYNASGVESPLSGIGSKSVP